MEFKIINNCNKEYRFKRQSTHILVHKGKSIWNIGEDIADRERLEEIIRVAHKNPRPILNNYYIMKYKTTVCRYVPGIGMVRMHVYFPVSEIIRSKHEDNFVKNIKSKESLKPKEAPKPTRIISSYTGGTTTSGTSGSKYNFYTSSNTV